MPVPVQQVPRIHCQSSNLDRPAKVRHVRVSVRYHNTPRIKMETGAPDSGQVPHGSVGDVSDATQRAADLRVDFAHKLEDQGLSVKDAVITACRVRLRPILMTSLATIIGMIPMALKLGEGAEQYTPMARAIIGGLTSSVLLTVFIVPAAYLLVYRNKRRGAEVQETA